VSIVANSIAAHVDRVRRFVLILVVYCLLGPPVGAVVFVSMALLVGSGAGAGLASVIQALSYTLYQGALVVYLIGILPAAGVGIAVAVRQANHGAMTWQMALGIGLLAGFVCFGYTGWRLLVQPPAGNYSIPAAYALIVLVSCVVPTMVCWLIVRRWHAAEPPIEPSS
jgi:hypothetical protein